MNTRENTKETKPAAPVRYTMADIAREAGVAKSTVSRYFNGGYVKEQTRQKIREVVERTGFEPSAAAQNLKLKTRRIIGVVCPTMTSASTGRLINAMDSALHEKGYACIVMTTDHDPQREIASIEYLRSLRVDGIVLIATNISAEHQRLQNASDIPFLTMGQKFPEGVSIVYDDFEAGRTIGAYARERGHRDIIYIGASEVDEAVGRIRKEGVLAGLGEDRRIMHIMMEETAFSYQETRELARDLLSVHVPDLIICATDMMALACYKEIREKGLRVPEDVSVAGFGGYEMSELLSPAMTTIRFENELAGKLCASTIISMINGEPAASLQVLGFTFLPGQSMADLRNSRPEETA